jgi:hypothetical protein
MIADNFGAQVRRSGVVSGHDGDLCGLSQGIQTPSDSVTKRAELQNFQAAVAGIFLVAAHELLAFFIRREVRRFHRELVAITSVKISIPSIISQKKGKSNQSKFLGRRRGSNVHATTL